jgi:ArsR family transcriptional regulator
VLAPAVILAFSYVLCTGQPARRRQRPPGRPTPSGRSLSDGADTAGAHQPRLLLALGYATYGMGQLLARRRPPRPHPTLTPYSYHRMMMSVQADATAGVDAAVRALADPLRARMVELLARERLCTCHLVALTGARQTNVSNHLRVLRDAGLIQAEPAGRYTYYRLRPEALNGLARHFDALAQRAGEAQTSEKECP